MEQSSFYSLSQGIHVSPLRDMSQIPLGNQVDNSVFRRAVPWYHIAPDGLVDLDGGVEIPLLDSYVR